MLNRLPLVIGSNTCRYFSTTGGTSTCRLRRPTGPPGAACRDICSNNYSRIAKQGWSLPSQLEKAEAIPTSVPRPETVSTPTVPHIRPSPGWRPVNLRELWQYRELLYFLI